MRRLVISEYESLSVGPGMQLSDEESARLHKFDDGHARRSGGSVFDWSRVGRVKARSYVGVVQIPGLQIEILPKTDSEDSDHRAQSNLLYMLEVGGSLKPRERSLATLRQAKAPLLDAFAIVFADSLIDELQRGIDRGYQSREENLSVLKGRLVFAEHVRRNSVQQQRVYVRYDEFTADTPLNRTLKCACRLLAKRVRSVAATRRLHEVVERLDEVSNVAASALIRPIKLSRQNARYQLHLDFAQLVLTSHSPDLASGDTSSFSMLFSMHSVFERFVAGFLFRYPPFVSGRPIGIVSQARGRHLATDEVGGRFFELRPDIVGIDAGRRVQFVLDTKWKLTDAHHPVTTVSSSDAYQAFAYAQCFTTPLTVLLYPTLQKSRVKDVNFAPERTLRVAQIDLSRDLRTSAKAVAGDLAELLISGSG